MNFVTGKADCGEDLLETAFGQVRVYLAQGGFQIFRKNDLRVIASLWVRAIGGDIGAV